MIFKNIGLSRVFFIACLFLLNVLFFLSLYFYMLPQQKESEQALRVVKESVQSKYAEVLQLRDDFSLLEGRLKEFSALELSGFFEVQNRLRAKEKIGEFSKKAEILKVHIEPKSGEIIESLPVAEAGHVLIKSPYFLKIEAQDDLDVFYFLKMMQTRFLGLVQFEKINIRRSKNLNAPLLRQIGNGQPEVLVKAEVEMNWITMPSKKDIE